MLFRVAAVIAVGVAVLGGTASAQGMLEQAEAKVKALSVELQAHTEAAKAEGGKGTAAMRANDRAGACAGFTKSREETQTVLGLLAQQREQVMLASADAATAIGRANKIDEMSGTWMGMASQLDQRIAQVCPA